MKILLLVLVLFSLIPSAYAENLCDESCEFSVTFPQGGRLEAIDELTLTFGPDGELILGTAGTVNTAIPPLSVDFSSAGTLVLSAGESITFGSGGALVLGTGGYIDGLSYNLYTTGDICIDSSGEIKNFNNTNGNIYLTGGNQTINFTCGWNASGTQSLASPSSALNSTITSGVNLNLANSTIISGTGSILVPQSATLTIGDVEAVVVGDFLLSSGSGVIDTSNTGIIYSNTELASPLPELEFQPLSSFFDTLNGLELTTSDGGICQVTAPECVTDDGTIYVLSTEGNLVKKEAANDSSASGNSGSTGLPMTGLLMIVLVLFSARKAKLGQ